MKKILSLTIVTVMLLASLCSCNEKAPNNNDGNIDNNDNNYNQNADDINPNNLSSLNIEEPSLCIQRDSSTGNIYAVWALKTFLLPDATSTVYLKSTTCGQYAWIFNCCAKGITLYKLSASGQMEVYENIYPEDIQFTEMTFAFASFCNETNGYLFFWRDDCYTEGWPIQFLRTSDGGKSWEMIKPENAPSAGHGKNYPELAKFLTKDIGIVTYRHDDPSDCGRTYVTTDGGETWKGIFDVLPYPSEISRDDTYSKLVDAYWDKYSNCLKIEVLVRSQFVDYTLRFKSYDLNEWILY